MIEDAVMAVTTRLKYLLENRDRHGKWRLYVRIGKRMIRIRAKLHTPEFFDEYRAAIEVLKNPTSPSVPTSRLQPATPGSLRSLCVRYFGSAEYKRLSEGTRHVRRLLLDRICERDGAKPYRLLEARHIRARRDEIADRPEAANAYVKVLRQVLAFAVAADLIDRNPAKDVPYIKGSAEGFHTWTLDEVQRFEKRHALGTKARLAFALLLYTGCRRSDVVTLGRQMVRDGWLHFAEAKGRTRRIKDRAIPILPECGK